MKISMISIVTSSILVAASLSMVGCSSGGGSTAAAAVDAVVSGVAADGYITGATVCLDVNDDGICQSGEPRPVNVTGADGAFSITLTPAQQALTDKPLLVYGGMDADTGLPIAPLKAPLGVGTVNITPISTMVHSMVANGTTTVAQAKEKVKVALGLTDVADVDADPVAVYLTKPEIAKATITVMRTVEMLALAAGGVVDTDDIFSDLVSAIENDDTLTGVANIVTASVGANISAGVAIAAQVMETNIAAIIATNSILADAAKLSDASADAVEDYVLISIDNNTTITLEAAQIAEDAAPTNLVEIAVANRFAAYSVAVDAAIVTEIATVLNTTEATVANIIALTGLTTTGAPAAVSALATAYNLALDAAKIYDVKIYLANLGQTSVVDGTMLAIANLTGYVNTMTKANFLVLLRASGNTALVALADLMDPPVVTAASLNWNDYSTMSYFSIDNEGSGDILRAGVLTKTSTLLNWSETVYNPFTSAWDAYANNSFDLVGGIWVEDNGIDNPISISSDGLTLTDSWGDVKIDSVVDLAGLTRTYTTSYGDINVTYGAGDEQYVITFKDKDSYELWENVIDYSVSSTTPYTSIASMMLSESVAWINTATLHAYVNFELDTAGAVIGLSGELAVGDTGNLVAIDASNNSPIGIVGTWTGVLLPGQSVVSLVCEPTSGNESYFTNDNGEVQLPIVAINNGTVWRGEHTLASTVFVQDDEEFMMNASAAAKVKAAVEAYSFQLGFTLDMLTAQTFYADLSTIDGVILEVSFNTTQMIVNEYNSTTSTLITTTPYVDNYTIVNGVIDVQNQYIDKFTLLDIQADRLIVQDETDDNADGIRETVEEHTWLFNSPITLIP